MKVLTLNFVTCAVKACKTSPASFPLHVRDAELEQVDLEFNELFLRNILPRLEWDALQGVAAELSLPLPPNPLADPQQGQPGSQSQTTDLDTLPDADSAPVDPASGDAAAQSHGGEGASVPEETLRKLHTLLLETQISSGKLVCGNCGHEYKIMEGIANFLLPAHLV